MKYNHTFLLLLVVLISNLGIAQHQLVVEVKTDKYADETSWKLFDTNHNVIQENNILEDTTLHLDTINLDENKCYYWTIYDSYGDGMSSYGYPGYFKIYFNGELIADSDVSNFGDSTSVYGIGASCSMLDVSINRIVIADTQSYSTFYLAFEIINFGSEQIKSLDLVYSIDEVESEVVTLENLNIDFGISDTLIIPDPINIDHSNDYQVAIEIQKVNASSDENYDNNKIIKDIHVLDGFWKKPMHEVFTANWCAPCAAANPIIDAIFDTHKNQYSLIKYQYYNDDYFAPHCGSMATFYGVNGVPSMYINGVSLYPGYYTDDLFKENTQKISDIKLSVDSKAIGDTVYSDIKIETSKNIDKESFVRVAVVENKTIGNIGTNGEQAFHNVFMRFLSSWDGNSIGLLNTENNVEINLQGAMNHTFVEEMSDLSIVVYVFHKDSYEILQSEMIAIPYSPEPPVITSNFENGVSQLDTLPVLEFYSNKPLENSDGTEILDITSNIVFHEFQLESNVPEFTANISDDKKTITILVTQSLEYNTEYHIELNNLRSNEGVALSDSVFTFSTIGNVNVSNEKQFNIVVYPNPATNLLVIESDFKCKIKIVNSLGIEIKQFENSESKSFVDISNFESGIYMIKMQNDNKEIIKRFVKL